jgi:SAM-dependent methyltransferase
MHSSIVATKKDAPPLDFERIQALPARLLTDFAAAMNVLSAGIGDRLGLFATLYKYGPLTLEELTSRTGYDAQMLHQWLQLMAAAGYIDYQPENKSFLLAEEHKLFANLDIDSGLAGGFQLILGFAKVVEEIIASFHTHQGVDQSLYDADLRSGMERMSAPWFESQLVDQWLPSAHLDMLLRRGIRVADIGCGRGRALLSMARRFPESSFTGYDLFGPVLEEAGNRAAESGLSERIHFVQHDISEPLPEQYELITFFNSLHDVAEPVKGLRSVREALLPGGCCLILESAFSDRLEENLNSLGSVLYGTGFFYNTPVGIANGACCAGGAALSEAQVHNHCAEAGLEVRRIRLPNPIHALYYATPK